MTLLSMALVGFAAVSVSMGQPPPELKKPPRISLPVENPWPDFTAFLTNRPATNSQTIPREQKPEALGVRVFRIDHTALARLCGPLVSTEPASVNDNLKALPKFLCTLGIDLQPPRSMFYSYGKGNLVIRATRQELDWIQENILKLTSVDPPK